MTQPEIIEKLAALKLELTKIGYEYLQTQLPLGLSEAPKVLKPFTDLENQFDKTIKQIQNKSILEK